MPVYSQIDSMHQKTIRKLVMGIVEAYAKFAVSGAPKDVVSKRGFMGLREAFLNAHALIPSPQPSPLRGEGRQSMPPTPPFPHPPQAEGEGE